MPSIDYTDFYILYRGHPRFEPSELIEDELIRVIIQKYEMILFTNTGEVMGVPSMGANLLELLYETKVSSVFVKNKINQQISQYIPEIANVNYFLDVAFTQDPNSYQDIMFIRFQIGEYEVFAQIGNFT